MLPKRGTIRFLALIFIFLISCTPASEIRAKPTKTSEQIIPAIHEFANTAVPSALPPKPADSTGAVALDEPKPKIDPQLVEELKELKRQKKHQRVRILLEAKDEESLERIQAAVQKAGGKIEQSFDIGDISVIEVQSDKVEELSEAIGVEQISTEKDYVAFLADRIPAFSVDTVWSNNITGKNVKIAILDTGVGPHDAINVAAAESFVSGEDTTDQNGHGTHVAGIAQGIAKDALIYNAKVLNKNGGGTTSQILAGINWAVQQDADIISMSFGGMFTELDGPLASAVKEAIQNGVVFVVASGNCKQGCGGFYGVTTPGNVKEVITVGAVDDNNVVASFSSGDTFDGYIKPDVVAPGIDITSAWLNNGQKTLSGTSMSAPFVAGMTALLLEKEPGLTHEQVKQRLERVAVDAGDIGKDTSYGSGLVNVLALIGVEVQTNFSASQEPSLPVEENTFATPPPDQPEFDGDYVTVPVNISAIQTQETDSPPAQVKIGIQHNLSGLSKEFMDSLNFTASSLPEYQQQVSGSASLTYTDSYAYLSSGSDAVTWAGSSLKVNLDSYESGTKVTCWDWCGDGTYDHCFSDTTSGYVDCMLDSTTSTLYKICNQDPNKCLTGGMDIDHPIDTVSSTDPTWKCNIKVEYFAKCKTAYAEYTKSKPYYVINKRRYTCNSLGGTYKDEGYYDFWQSLFSSSTSCSSGKACDTAKDKDLALFTSGGWTAPAAPCTTADGYTCNNDEDCLSTSHCSQVPGQDYCCPSGKEYVNGQCFSSCNLGAATWVPAGPVFEGTSVQLKVSAPSACNGQAVTFTVYENEIFSDTVITSLTDTSYSNGYFSVTWSALYDASAIGDPQYYFVATPTYGSSKTSADLTVQQPQCNNNAQCEPLIGESSANCPSDCASPCVVDGNCNTASGETAVNCPNDCAATCNYDGSCDPGETQASCPDDCTTTIICDNDGTCEPGQGESVFNCVNDCKLDNGANCNSDVQCVSGLCYQNKCASCPDADGDGFGNPGMTGCTGGLQTDCDNTNQFIFPGAQENCGNTKDDNCNNLVNENCSCAKNSECYSGLQCIFDNYNGQCKSPVCQNECGSSGTYTCAGTSIYQCTNTDSDSCLELKYIDNCYTGTFCEDGKSACQQAYDVSITLEESLQKIYVQPDDWITVHLTVSQPKTIQIQTDSAVVLDTNTCPSGAFTLTGTRACKFKVSSSATGKHSIRVKNGPSREFEVISNPGIVIGTSKSMLQSRFNDQDAVQRLLQAAYAYAAQKRAVIYDLDGYQLSQHPFLGKPYLEKFDFQFMKDNTYSLQAGNFLQDRCNGCLGTLILGDDYIVPHYRRDLDMSVFFGLTTETDEIYSDISYIERTTKEFAEFEELFYQKGKFDGKNVLIMLPNNVDAVKREQIDRIEDFLKKNVNAKIEERNGNDVVCNSHQAFTVYSGYTAIVIGTESTNKALDCFPFAVEESLETVTIERNPWDGRAYAVVVNSDRTNVLSFLADALETGAYKELHSSGWLIVQTADEVTMGISIGTSTAALAPTPASPALFMIGKVSGIVNSAIKGAECWGLNELHYCGEAIIGIALPWGAEKISPVIIKAASKTFGSLFTYFERSLGPEIVPLLQKLYYKGMLEADSGFYKIMKFLRDNDFLGNSVTSEIIDLISRSPDEFLVFMNGFAKNNLDDAIGILKISKATNIAIQDLRTVASSKYLPARLFVKYVDGVDSSFAYIPYTKQFYSNGLPMPLFKGASLKVPTDPLEASKLVSNDLSFRHGQKGYDLIRQMADGTGSDQAVSSMTRDLRVAAYYSRKNNNNLWEGYIAVYDPVHAPLADSQAILKKMSEKIPDASVHTVDEITFTVKQVYEDSLVNNEVSHLGQPSIKYLIGWFKTARQGDKQLLEFIPNPEYIGDPSEWSHVLDINKIRELQKMDNIEFGELPGRPGEIEATWDTLVGK